MGDTTSVLNENNRSHNTHSQLTQSHNKNIFFLFFNYKIKLLGKKTKN